MVVVSIPAPMKVSDLSTITCSVYVPAAILIMSPGVAMLTACWTVLHGFEKSQVGLSVPVVETYRELLYRL